MPRFNTLKEWLHWQESLHPLAIDLGLERAARVFHALAPDYRKPVTITVAGTNGKGSCVAYLETIYREQGYRVGAYTSPHIQRYNERIKIDGVPVTDEAICQAFTRIEAVGVGTGDSIRSEIAPIYRNRPDWLPAVEVFGEGIFVRFSQDALRTWEREHAGPLAQRLAEVTQRLEDPDEFS
ncbi:MAG: hypothetical protein ACU83P_12645, partial [Gammaproteobacteria bacterium]